MARTIIFTQNTFLDKSGIIRFAENFVIPTHIPIFSVLFISEKSIRRGLDEHCDHDLEMLNATVAICVGEKVQVASISLHITYIKRCGPKQVVFDTP